MKLLDDFLNRRRRTRFLNMPVLAMRAIRAKPHVIHAALLDVPGVVLEDAILLVAGAAREEEVAHRHAVLVVLLEELAGLALHAQCPEPVPAHGLPGDAARLDVFGVVLEDAVLLAAVAVRAEEVAHRHAVLNVAN